MKALIESLQHERHNLRDFFPTESYVLVARTTGPENRKIRIEIEGNVIKNPLIKADQENWEYDIEITITAKPKQEGLIIKL